MVKEIPKLNNRNYWAIEGMHKSMEGDQNQEEKREDQRQEAERQMDQSVDRQDEFTAVKKTKNKLENKLENESNNKNIDRSLINPQKLEALKNETQKIIASIPDETDFNETDEITEKSEFEFATEKKLKKAQKFNWTLAGLIVGLVVLSLTLLWVLKA